MIRADALAVHLNFLQESVQPEGERGARGVRMRSRRGRRSDPLPVLAKETGAGISRATALRLKTSACARWTWAASAAPASRRSKGCGPKRRATLGGQRLGEIFRDWGYRRPCRSSACCGLGLPVIATGGIRTGLDAAKALALGATLVGVARPLLQAALEGDQAVDAWIGQFLLELRTALFLSGSANAEALRLQPRVVTGATRAWIEQLGKGLGGRGKSMRPSGFRRSRLRSGPALRASGAGRPAPPGRCAAIRPSSSSPSMTGTVSLVPSRNCRQCAWPLGLSSSCMCWVRTRKVVVLVVAVRRGQATQHAEQVFEQQRLGFLDTHGRGGVARDDRHDAVAEPVERTTSATSSVMSRNWIGSWVSKERRRMLTAVVGRERVTSCMSAEVSAGRCPHS